ncbi:hypothetical protein EVAR_39796_1 [Eumeta japonica]|uniref:Uncharacterized protein n=1 Tax=Eumeta variegata TaxID=151549 RepID=A0A4C1X6T2_EUMVA|nr:hypothetical protein EVAR_39796_1 [Eumeta japonica]
MFAHEPHGRALGAVSGRVEPETRRGPSAHRVCAGASVRGRCCGISYAPGSGRRFGTGEASFLSPRLSIFYGPVAVAGVTFVNYT